MLIAIVSCTATNPYRVLRSISDDHPPLTGYKLCPIVQTVMCFNCDGQGSGGGDGVGDVGDGDGEGIYGDDGDDPITKVASSLGATEKED